jgi:hypothetical protein
MYILKVSFDQTDQSGHRGRSVRSFGSEKENGVFGGLRGHHLDDALGVDPGTIL